jgi:hypothetical protein
MYHDDWHLSGGIPTINRQTDSCDPASIVTCQDNSHFRDIIRESRALQWVSPIEIVPRGTIIGSFLEDGGLSI